MPSRSKRGGAHGNKAPRMPDAAEICAAMDDPGALPPQPRRQSGHLGGRRGGGGGGAVAACDQHIADQWQQPAPAGMFSVPAAAMSFSDKGKHSEIFQKTKMCKFHILGMCAKGTDCQFAHSMEDMNPLPDLYRTKLCKNLINTGKCDNPTCKYAHNKVELRTANMTRHGASCGGGGGGSNGCKPNAKSRIPASKQRLPDSFNLQPCQGENALKAQMDFQENPGSTAAGGLRVNDQHSGRQMPQPPMSMITPNGEHYPVIMHPAMMMPQAQLWYQQQGLTQGGAWSGFPDGSQTRAGTSDSRSPADSPSTRSEGHSRGNSNGSNNGSPGTPPPSHLYHRGGPGHIANAQGGQWNARSESLQAQQQVLYDSYGTPCVMGLQLVQDDPYDDDGMFNNESNGITIKNTFLEIGSSAMPRPMHKVSTAGGRLEFLAQESFDETTPRDAPRGVACH